jgi:Caspase domain
MLSFASAVTAALLAASEVEPHRSFAFIVTNNRSLDGQRADLQYADDDGAQYADLFAQLFGVDNVTLLTTFDAPSRLTHANWVSKAVEPTKASMKAAVKVLAGRLAEEKRLGRSTQVVLIFAGHGDLDSGTGFVELQDTRLDADEFEKELVEQLPADNIDLIFDSCNSYFMLNPRKPGGKRWATEAPRASLLARHANVGALLSTSAEAVTYEWSELQSGIFSHEVRSGLRGGADANGDSQVTYAELAAFITVANRKVPNDLYRPKVFARGPSGAKDRVLVDLKSAVGRQLHIPSGQPHRLTLRDAVGTRVADLHTESAPGTSLLLPMGNSLSLLEVLSSGEDAGRPQHVDYQIPETGESFSLQALSRQSQSVAQRGDTPVFRALFADSFGPQAFAEVAPTVFSEKPEDLPQGISRLDAERLGSHLSFLADETRMGRRLLSVSYAGLGGAALTAALIPSSRGNGDDRLRLGMGMIGASLLGAGVISFFLKATPEENMAVEFAQLDKSTESARASSVLLMEGKFKAAAESAARMRHIAGGVEMALGAAYIGLSVALLANPKSELNANSARLLYFGAGLGATMILQGLFVALFFQQPIERAFRFYQQNSRLSESLGTGKNPGVSFSPSVSVVPGGGSIGVQGTFW